MSQYGPLRQLSRLLETQSPSDDYSLVHIRPEEAQILEQITGRNEFMPGTGIRKFAQGGASRLGPLSSSVMRAGRGGDTQLAYVRPEHVEILKRAGGSGTVNPKTGLQEYGLFSSIGKVLKGVGKAVKSIVQSPIGQIVLPIALTVLAPGIGTALGMSAAAAGSAAWAGAVTAIGTTAANKVTGASWGDALKSGAFAGAMSGVGKGLMTGNWIGGSPPVPPAPMSMPGVSETAAAGLPTPKGPLSALAAAPSDIGATPGFYSSLSNASPASAASLATPSAYSIPSAVSAAAPAAIPTAATSGSGNFLTNPLFFKETPGVMGDIGRAATSPLALGAMALAASSGSGGGNSDKFDPYFKEVDEQDKAMNEAYINAISNPQAPRPYLAPQIGTDYGYGGEKLFFGSRPRHRSGGPLRMMAQGGEFHGPVRGPGGGQDDKIYLENSRLANGEFVMDSTTVADAGDGSTEEGFKVMEEVRKYIRNKKGRRHSGPIPQKLGGLSALKKVLG